MGKVQMMVFVLSMLFGGVQAAAPDEDASRIIGHITETVKKKYGFSAVAVGAAEPGKIQCIEVNFSYEHPIAVDEARYLIVSMVADALQYINSDEKVRLVLGQYPYAASGINVGLYASRDLKRKLQPGTFGLFAMRKGVLSFKRYKEDFTIDHENVQTETFEEALEILKKQGRLPDYFKDK